MFKNPKLSGICNTALNIVEFVIRQNTLCFVNKVLFGQLQIIQCSGRHFGLHFKCHSGLWHNITEISVTKPG